MAGLFGSGIWTNGPRVNTGTASKIEIIFMPPRCQKHRQPQAANLRGALTGRASFVSLPTMKTITLMALILAAGCTKPAQNSAANANNEPPPPVNTNDVAVIETKYGKMVAEFFHADAPNTIANFQKLARKGFYDGTTFHRVIKGFMIQGGDPLSKDPKNKPGSGSPGYSIKAEFNNQPHRLGVLSMARSSHPDSAGCQFFICLNRLTDLDGQYTVFGKLIAGEDVLEKIGSVPTKLDRTMMEESIPVERVVIEHITIVPRTEALK